MAQWFVSVLHPKSRLIASRFGNARQFQEESVPCCRFRRSASDIGIAFDGRFFPTVEAIEYLCKGALPQSVEKCPSQFPPLLSSGHTSLSSISLYSPDFLRDKATIAVGFCLICYVGMFGHPYFHSGETGNGLSQNVEVLQQPILLSVMREGYSASAGRIVSGLLISSCTSPSCPSSRIRMVYLPGASSVALKPQVAHPWRTVISEIWRTSP